MEENRRVNIFVRERSRAEGRHARWKTLHEIRIIYRAKINQQFDVNPRKPGVGWYLRGKFHYSPLDGKSFPSLRNSARSIHRWNADKRADEPVRALIAESGNSSRKKEDFADTFVKIIEVFVLLRPASRWNFIKPSVQLYPHRRQIRIMPLKLNSRNETR